jgi:phosphate-selective porin OprO/OprP
MILELRSEIRKLEQRVDTLEDLDQRVKVIDQKVEVQQQAEVVRQKTTPVIKAGADGFSISSPDKDYSFKLGALIQGDGRFFTSGSDKTPTGSTFFLNRARPIFTGVVAKWFEFNLTPDFGQGKVTRQDAFTTRPTISRRNYCRAPIRSRALAIRS